MAKLNQNGEPIPYGLSERQFNFACELAETRKSGKENRYLAAKRAGYQGSYESLKTSGSRLAKQPGVMQLVDQMHSEWLETAEVGDLSPEEVIGMLRNEAKTAKSDQARVSAATQLGRVLGIFSDRLETSQTLPIEVQLKAMSNNDISELIGSLQTELDGRG